jgi:uncharacterized protein (UPF0332 family)
MKEDRRDEYVMYRLKRSHETVGEADSLLKDGFWNGATNRLYYACFYAVSALLLKSKIDTSSHSGTLHKFNEMFVRTRKVDREFFKLYAELFEKRQRGDYSDSFDLDEATVKRLYGSAIEFLRFIEALIKEMPFENSSNTPN